MPNMTLSIPEPLFAKMKALKEVRWSEIARQAIESRINDLEEMNKIASKSKLTEKDVWEFTRKIKKAIASKYK